MKTLTYHPWVHRYALLTAAAAWLLPILAGALVTTKDAGMAFPDWPRSDGWNPFLYPWLKSAGDKFLEHGHRLAGALIGILSIGLAGLVLWCETRPWVKYLGSGVLLCVILQGVLGGQRVLLDARGLAFMHGVFASWVFALMGAVAVCTSQGWLEADRTAAARWSGVWRWASLFTAALVAFQYLLGALVRHQGTMLYEHAAFAVVIFVLACWTLRQISKSGVAWIIRPAAILVLLVTLQFGLGLATYVVKFGFGSYVAQYGSTLQIAVRTSHVLLGMLVWISAVVTALRVWRLDSVLRRVRIAGAVDRANTVTGLARMLSVERSATLSLPGGAK